MNLKIAILNERSQTRHIYILCISQPLDAIPNTLDNQFVKTEGLSCLRV